MSSATHLEGKTLTFILAGVAGERLYPLTADQPKLVVPFWRRVLHHRLQALERESGTRPGVSYIKEPT
jgi:hypothetical protein